MVLLVFLCLSRFGLWSFDLCETQLMQLHVSPEHAGVINASQETLVNVCAVVSFLLTIIFADPDLFAIPAWISFASVVIAGVLYATYCSRELGTQNPFPPMETFKLHKKVEYDPTADWANQEEAERQDAQRHPAQQPHQQQQEFEQAEYQDGDLPADI